MHEEHTKQVINAIRAQTTKPLWVKLSPNAGDIVSIAMAAEEAGADCLVIANTFLSLKIRTDNSVRRSATSSAAWCRRR